VPKSLALQQLMGSGARLASPYIEFQIWFRFMQSVLCAYTFALDACLCRVACCSATRSGKDSVGSENKSKRRDHFVDVVRLAFRFIDVDVSTRISLLPFHGVHGSTDFLHALFPRHSELHVQTEPPYCCPSTFIRLEPFPIFILRLIAQSPTPLSFSLHLYLLL
jgi:hypothetical protein